MTSQHEQQTAAGYGDDGWRICQACEEEVLEADTKVCDSGCDFCPSCWADLTDGREVEH